MREEKKQQATRRGKNHKLLHYLDALEGNAYEREVIRVSIGL